MIIAAGGIEEFKGAHSIGIGLTDSAIELTRICLLYKPNRLIFVGSAGSYGNKNIFDIIKSTYTTP